VNSLYFSNNAFIMFIFQGMVVPGMTGFKGIQGPKGESGARVNIINNILLYYVTGSRCCFHKNIHELST